MHHHLDITYVLIGAAGFISRSIFKKYLSDACVKAFSWFFERYILKSERRLAIWWHHKFHHGGRNALHCEVGGCTKVTPR